MATLREAQCRSSLSRRFSTFQPSRNDQAIFLSLMIPLARLSDVSKVVNRNRRPRKLFIFFVFFFLSSFREPSAVLSESMTTKPAQTHVYIFWVVHLLDKYQTLPEASIQRKTCILGYKRRHFVLYPLRVCVHPYILAHKMAV